MIICIFGEFEYTVCGEFRSLSFNVLVETIYPGTIADPIDYTDGFFPIEILNGQEYSSITLITQMIA